MKSQTFQAWLHATALVFALLALGSALSIGHFGLQHQQEEPANSGEEDLGLTEPIKSVESETPKEPRAMPIGLLTGHRQKNSPARRALLEFRKEPVLDLPAIDVVAESVDTKPDPPVAETSVADTSRTEDLDQVATVSQALPQPAPFPLQNPNTHPSWLKGDGFIVGWDGTRCLTAGQLDESIELSRSLANLPALNLSSLSRRVGPNIAPVAYTETPIEKDRYEDADLWESDQDSSNQSGGGGTDGKQPSPIGVPPPRPQPQFLRDTSVLLDPGEYQFEYGVSYTTNLQTTAIGVDVNDNTVVTSLRTLTRTATLPMEFRVGCRNDTQAFMSLPIGYNLQQISIANTADSNDGIGIGDLSFGCTRVLRKPQPERFTILGNISASAPTGLAQLSNIQQVPGVALGSGYWSLTGGMVFIRTIDPIAAYVGVNVTQTFESTLSNLELNPGNIFSYRFGLGYAINSRVSISSSFNGAYISELEVGGRLIPGSAREPLTVRLAATILSRGPSLVGSAKGRRKTTEPFIVMGITDAAPDTNFGIRWTY